MPFWIAVGEVEMAFGILVGTPGSRRFGLVGSIGNCRAEADYIACPS
jgi:hypothetical protein